MCSNFFDKNYTSRELPCPGLTPGSEFDSNRIDNFDSIRSANKSANQGCAIDRKFPFDSADESGIESNRSPPNRGFRLGHYGAQVIHSAAVGETGASSIP